ncbi:ATP-binding protein [Actinoplanes sp. NPDC049681]|uniref:PAS domain-containing sensor histidine kinase n=1 Tax=Actinoplanes sp. NPDC049681 TaxID=3363905 RepID=UPI0037942381
MVSIDRAVLADPARLEAVELYRRLLPVAPLPMDAIAQLAAHLLDAPMGAVTLVAEDEEFVSGRYGLPEPLCSQRKLAIKYSLCKYVVSADHVLNVPDMCGGGDPELSSHPLLTEYGVCSFLSVPIRDPQDQLVGALTVCDTKPRHWRDEHTTLLLEVEQLLRPADGTAPPRAMLAALDSAALLDGVQQALVAVNVHGTVVGFNRAAEQLLGFTKDDICDRHFDERLVPLYNGEPIGAALSRLFSAAPALPVRRPISLLHRDGHRVNVDAAFVVVHGAAGALACVFMTDHSRQKAAEERADHSDHFLSALLDSLSVGVLACDASSEVVVMNRALREIHELPEDAEIPADYASAVERFLYDSDHRPMPWAETPLMRACAGEVVRDTDIVVDVPGKRTRTFAVTAQPITGRDGRSRGAVSVSHEVTALRRVEQFRACHLSVEQAFKAAATVAEAAPNVLHAVVTTLGWPAAELFLIDDVSGELRAVGHWSAGGLESGDFFGHTPVKGAGVTGRVWQTGKPVWVPEIADEAALSSSFERERVEVCLRHGIHTVIAVPVTDGDSLLGVLTCYAGAAEHHEDLLTVLLDGVAAQIGVFVALRRAQELARQLARAQDDFISLVGHELRTPLTSIAVHAGVLASDGDRLDDDSRQSVDAIARNAADLQAIITTLLELAGLDSGHLPLTVTEVDLTRIVEEAVADAASHIAGQDLRLHVDAPDRVSIEGDAARLREVLRDLLSNAVKYSPRGGDIRVSLQADAEMAELRITDEGIGTPVDERDQIFDRFYRGRNVRHQGTHGHGLGLSLARTIVQLHGGTIKLLDNAPTGTAVVVCLPCRHDADGAVSRV